MLPCDVTDAAAVAAAVAAFAERAGRLDLVVCSAGAGAGDPPPPRDRSLDEARRASAAIWPGTLLTVDAALGALRAGGGGRIVVVVGPGTSGGAAGAAARSAQRAFAEALRGELAGSEVAVTVVAPGDRDADPHALAARVVEAVDYDEPVVRAPWGARALSALSRRAR